MTRIPMHAEVAVTSENKCSLCQGAKCCTYLTQHIPTPRSMEDFDLLLWQISHRDVAVYKDSDGWFLLVNTPCVHLLPDGRCGIYAERPTVCRDHSNDFCEFDAPAEEGFELYFDSYASLLTYCRERFRAWDRRRHSA